ncbi:outer membrane beta-barrel protein [Flavobacterium sp. SUN052]|uniref:outer membrane beta-barrel protein n=1 Tax=Flavobacterium sp. SUN052 TaxID=3002441 RepID=UPI00237E2F8D|nr:outer membrane beta-barrel protein [Flavobacterium sp. SUN052]MEC4003453.1 outer membrane beta-barrel protein [Flavobacterium sp. SUN052]
MSERKNINNFFQDKFENFEVTPEPIVWDNIEAKLKEKKKRRIIPFWWNFAGIAAALLIGVFVYNFGFKNSNISVDTNKSIGTTEVESAKKANGISNKNTINAVKSNAIKGAGHETVVLNDTNTKTKSNIKSSNNTNSNDNEVANLEVVKNKHPKIKNQISINKNDNVLSNHSQEKVVTASLNKNSVNKSSNVTTISSEKKLAFVKRQTSKSEKRKNQITATTDNALTLETVIKNKKETLEEKKETFENKNKSFSNDNKNTTVVTNFDEQKSALNPILEKDITTSKKIDSTKIAIVEPNALEELQNEKEKKMITEPKLNRWQVSSNVAPIYFSSLSSGSPLDNRLKDNEKSYSANNQSYGIGASYALNKKLKIRTGVNVLNVDYNTNGITYYQTESFSSKLANLNLNIAGSSIVIENLSNVNVPFNKITQKAEGSLNQKLGYIEMPLEITYKVLDKKFGIDFIGGMSTMILNKNEIYLQSSSLNLKIGEANNLNDIHFSGNLGLGFKYDILKHFEARLEPVFKYQINTFSTDSGNFKPYMFGVYSGVNFTF